MTPDSGQVTAAGYDTVNLDRTIIIHGNLRNLSTAAAAHTTGNATTTALWQGSAPARVFRRQL